MKSVPWLFLCCLETDGRLFYLSMMPLSDTAEERSGVVKMMMMFVGARLVVALEDAEAIEVIACRDQGWRRCLRELTSSLLAINNIINKLTMEHH